MAHAKLDVGSTANSYTILAKLASGGMAELFLARNASAAGVERFVVLKRVLRAHDSEEVRMFLDEAKLAAQLQHPNIAQLYDTGKLGDSFFFTMEYVHGETVRELVVRAIQERRQIPISVALTIIAGAAAGLHHAHERNGIDGHPLGIVHRDVSPSNLMVSYEGNVKVVDFGIAKARSSSIETQSGTVRGKITYLSPEQCRARTLDRRSDLFSLGIVLWELLVCERLYKHASDYENMTAIIHDDAPLPSSRRADVPPEVDALARKLLARKPADRFQTGAELLEEIERVAARASWQLSSAGLGRYMRELFGSKPEPWMELRAKAAAAEAVTVTAAPVDGLHPWQIHVDRQLSDVIDLGALTAATVVVTPPSSRRRRRSRRSLIAIGGLAAFAIGVAIGAVVRSARGGESQPSDAPAAVAPLALSPAAVADAGAPVAVIADAAPAPVAVPPKQPVRPAHHLDDLGALSRAGRSAEVVGACATSPSVVTQNAATCTLAACQLNDTNHARHWLLEVPAAHRAAIVASCLDAGTVLEAKAKQPPPPPPPPPPRGNCENDPLACRR